MPRHQRPFTRRQDATHATVAGRTLIRCLIYEEEHLATDAMVGRGSRSAERLTGDTVARLTMRRSLARPILALFDPPINEIGIRTGSASSTDPLQLLKTINAHGLDSEGGQGGNSDAVHEIRDTYSRLHPGPVAPGLASGDFNTRVNCLRALARVGGKNAIGMIEGALDDDDPKTVAWAANSLQQSPNLDSIPAMVRCLELRRDQFPVETEGCLTRALAKHGDERGIEQLVISASRPDQDVRQMGLRGLAYIRTARSAAALDQLMTDLTASDRRYVSRMLKEFPTSPS